MAAKDTGRLAILMATARHFFADQCWSSLSTYEFRAIGVGDPRYRAQHVHAIRLRRGVKRGIVGGHNAARDDFSVRLTRRHGLGL